ncbi:MAG: glycoside hydrolase family 32 protein [Lachnospiraceae bacterium]|nr:glycoside hydrolase family 32 protein [Lachnospiraceae bacterium]
MKKDFTIKNNYIGLPIRKSADGRKVENKLLKIYYSDVLVAEFSLEMDEKTDFNKKADFISYIKLTGLNTNNFYPDKKAQYALKEGDTITVETDLPEKFFTEIEWSDTIPFTPVKTLHYHPPYGFLNDPNGLTYVDGIYHIFHQHNPVSQNWGNMSWGHTITKDFKEYTFLGDEIIPDSTGVVFSGCGLINKRKAFSLPEDAILYFYTTACPKEYSGEKPESLNRGYCAQRMAYSLDNGKTVRKYGNWELPMIENENRDPKIFYHDESNSYIMSLYLTGNRFAIFRSADLNEWTKTQELDLPPMWECPDLFELIGENGEKKWAFMSADGYYYIGEFDGYKFTPEGDMKKLYSDKYPYAAQSFSNISGRVLSIAWLRLPNNGENHTGCMSIPREFTLGKDSEGYFIKQSFAREVADLIETTVDGTKIKDANITEIISGDGKYLSITVL